MHVISFAILYFTASVNETEQQALLIKYSNLSKNLLSGVDKVSENNLFSGIVIYYQLYAESYIYIF